MALRFKPQQAAKVELPTPPVENTDVITLDQVGSKLKELENYALTFRGKPNCNPFIWIAEKLEPLKKEVRDNPSQELFKRILDMLPEKPTV